MTQVKNPFIHSHDHDHDHHGHHHHHHDDDFHVDELDPAQQSLSDALRVSFFILKVIMVILLVAYLCSGIFRVEETQRALRLRFGQIVGQPGEQVLGPGWHVGLPYPIEQVIKVPINQKTLDINKAFWYEVTDQDLGKTAEELAGRAGPLNPEKDGSLVTGDANIVHARWQVTYKIASPVDYARNVGSMQLADELVTNAAEQGVVHAIAQAKADDIIRKQLSRSAAISRMQDVLGQELETGIEIESLSLTLSEMPLSVRSAYQAVINAESEKAQKIETAQQERSKVLGETAGESRDQLYALVKAYEQARSAGPADIADRLDAQLRGVLSHLRLVRPAQGVSYEQVYNLLTDYQQAQALGETDTAATTLTQLEAALDALQDAMNDLNRALEIRSLALNLPALPESVAAAYDSLLAASPEALAQQVEVARQTQAKAFGQPMTEVQSELTSLVDAVGIAVEAGDAAVAQQLKSQLQWVLTNRKLPEPAGRRAFGQIAQALAGADAQANLADLIAQPIQDVTEASEQLEWAAATADSVPVIPVGGQVAEKINEATTYRTAIVERVRAEAASFASLHDEYVRSPRILMSRLWQDAREKILTGDVETFYSMAGQFYPVLNRDPKIQREREEQRLKDEAEQRRQEGQQGR